MTPLKLYQQGLENQSIKHDELQFSVVKAFNQLYAEITHTKKKWFFKKSVYSKGLYIFGNVGRGKTFLMDLFVTSLNQKKIRRLHFHEFMLWFHKNLRSIKNKQNPIELVIKKLSEEVEVLCLDEFLVHDITDAMILSKILEALKEYNISLVTTSNIEPSQLYRGGLQRKKFLPSIDWISNNMKILHLDGAHDFRTQTSICSERNWLTPNNKDNQQLFEQLFNQKIVTEKLHISPIEINKRSLAVIKRTKNHIMFEFETLCYQPRNANDFIQLCKLYQSVFVVINHKIEDSDRNTARRFITLIDVFYDHQMPLYVISNRDFKDLYSGTDLAFEMQRTVSRLTEMQSFA
jgi:cell division protein ZapE